MPPGRELIVARVLTDQLRELNDLDSNLRAWIDQMNEVKAPDSGLIETILNWKREGEMIYNNIADAISKNIINESQVEAVCKRLRNELIGILLVGGVVGAILLTDIEKPIMSDWAEILKTRIGDVNNVPLAIIELLFTLGVAWKRLQALKLLKRIPKK